MQDEKKPYRSFLDGNFVSEQREYTEKTPLLDDKGNLLAAGWARRMVFDYDRTKVKPALRNKEWEYYLISNGELQVLLSFANVSVAGYASICLNDLRHADESKKYLKGMLVGATTTFVGGRNKYVLPKVGDRPNRTAFHITGLGAAADCLFDTTENSRTVEYKTTYKGKPLECRFVMDIPEGHENITTVLPFDGQPTRFFMTTKQNCMPCEGVFKYGDEVWTFSKDNTFCCMDWGRVCAPRRINWYWGNGSTYLYDDKGVKHTFGFEITWGIGNESKATETCLFYDGKAHKIGAVDVKTFPKPDKYMQDWVITSQDGRFEMTMHPFYDHFSDLNIVNAVRVICHQAHGLWNGKVTLDDGTVLTVKDMYAFCEYVENKW